MICHGRVFKIKKTNHLTKKKHPRNQTNLSKTLENYVKRTTQQGVFDFFWGGGPVISHTQLEEVALDAIFNSFLWPVGLFLGIASYYSGQITPT